MITKYRPIIRNPTLTRILGVLRRAGGVIDGSKTPMLYYYDSERSLSFHVGLSISDALGTMLIRRGQLLFGKL